MTRTLAKSVLTVALAIALGPFALAQSRVSGEPLPIAQQSARVTLDGRLAEWGGAVAVRLDGARDMAHASGGPAWRGPQDLSATIYLSYDDAHLYVAAEILDDELVRDRDAWDQGDSVELFLDLDLTSVSTEDRDGRLAEDEFKIVLMPLNPQRGWGVVVRRGDDFEYGGSSFSGVRVAHQELDGAGYSFEAVIPFHNFAALVEGTRRVGFEVAVNDRDGGVRHQYLTSTGTIPGQSGGLLRPLEFSGEGAPLELGPAEGGDFYRRLRGLSGYILWPVLVFLAGALCLRSWRWTSQRHASLGLVAPMFGVLLLALGLLLPEWLRGSRAGDSEASLESVVATLRAHLPDMERGTLGSYRGGERDRPFVSLLSGRSVPRVQTVSHERLGDLAVGQFGEGPSRYPSDFDRFPLRPYWIPLPGDSTESFSFDPPLEGDYLNVVVALPTFRRGDLAPGLRVAVQYADGEPPVVEQFELERHLYTSCITFGYPEREMTFVQLELDALVSSISLMPLGVENLRLVGLTLIPTTDEQGRPLHLGQASLGGVETELRGGYPEDAGIRLTPGESRRVEVDPADARSFEKLWLFYKADYPGADKPLPYRGELVAEVVLHFAGAKPAARTIAFRHQESMFFELAGKNQDAEPIGEQASVAFRWEVEEQEQHLTLGYEEDLPDDAVVEAIEFKNLTGSYSVHFRSAVFRESKPTVRVEPAGSPLELTDSRNEVKMKDDVLDQLRGASFAIYRSGVLEQATVADAPTNLPRGLERRLSPDELERRVVESPDARVYEAYLPLSGEGWSGAVLGVSLRDDGYGAYLRWVSRIGVLLCLLAAPALLSLFSSALTALNHLRVRLMAVLTVAALVPLTLLSIALVQVLENGHESSLRNGMQQAVATASTRLEDQERELLSSVRKWLDALVEEVGELSTAAAGDSAQWDDLRERLEATMASQKPPDWGGGFMRAELSGPERGAGVTAFVGDPALQMAETPLRKEPGIYLSWGIPFVGVRWEREIPGFGLCSLSVAQPVDEGFLGGLSPGRGVLLCDTRGYPLVGAEGAAPSGGGLFGRSGVHQRLISERRSAFEEVLDGGQPVIARHAADGQKWIAAYDVLRDLEETPRAMLGVLDVDREAVLPLALGAVPVRTFFLAVGSLLLLLAGFLSFVVSARISEPIERLERGARALSRGEFDVRVDTEEGGQIGRLTRTFNTMAQELRGRLQDLDHLNRGIREFTSKLDLKETVTSVVGFCARYSSADRVRLLLRNPERDRVEVHGETVEVVDRRDPDVAALLIARGPLSIRLRPGSILAECFPDYSSCVVLPLVLASRSRGAVLLLFESAQPSDVNLELLTTMAAQAAAALENARLYLHAVEDPFTGAFVPDPFRRRVAQAVEHALAGREELALLEVSLTGSARLHESLGDEQFGVFMERAATLLRGALPPDVVLCRAADETFQVLMVGAGREVAQEAERAVRDELARARWEPHISTRLRIHVASALFPSEAASAEFLFHALAGKRAPAVALPMTEQMRGLESEGFAVQSPVMQSVFRTLARVAPTDLTLLLEGETGTGKEVLTNLIHRWSKRGQGPLVKVHCAALSESLLQSELFGHEKGAFTGAIARKVGKFEQAQAGTIFLDEIGEVSLDTQVKLLRVLQEREIDRVGGVEPVPVDVRVVAATNRNIRSMVADGSFREDLYYRLQGMVVTVPPLRDRKPEIPGLVEFFRREAIEAGQTTVRGFRPDAMDELFRRPWPGNIRELRNTVFRAMVFARGEEVRREDLLGILERPDGASLEAEASRDDGEEPLILVAEPPVEAAPSTGRADIALRLVEERGSITTQEYISVAGVSKRTGLRDLAQLVERGLLERVGRRRGARYRRAT